MIGPTSSRWERIFLIHIPIIVSGLIWTFLYVGVAVSRDWSDRQFFAGFMAIASVWTVFVVVPLLIVIAPPKQ